MVSLDDIKDALKDIRKQRTEGNRYEKEQDFIELLEGKDYCRDFNYSPRQLYFICDAYIKSILDTYLFDPQKVEIVLAAFGMLEGCSVNDSSTARHIQYVKRAFGCNENITQSWFNEAEKNKAENPRKKEDDVYFETIARNLIDTGQVGSLGLFDDIVATLQAEYPSGIPEEIPLIAPRFTNDAQAEKGKSEQDRDTSEPPQKKRVKRIQLLSIFSMLLFLACLSASVGTIIFFQNNDNTIQSISVLDSDITLYPGGFERLQISTAPADADRDTLECHSDSNPWITVAKTADWEDTNIWTEAWSTIAASDWTEALPFSGKVSVMGGDANPVYVDVTVENPAYKQNPSTTDGFVLGGSNDAADAGTPDTP